MLRCFEHEILCRLAVFTVVSASSGLGERAGFALCIPYCINSPKIKFLCLIGTEELFPNLSLLQ